MAISKSIGCFILIEYEYLLENDCCVPRMLVEVDVSEGIKVELEVVMEGNAFSQRVDYWRLPFRCPNCKETRHAKSNCFNSCFGYVIKEDLLPLEEDSDVMESILNFPIHLDVNLASYFLHKFCNQILVCLKILFS